MQRSHVFESALFRLLLLPGLLFTALLVVTPASFAGNSITLENPWIAEAPPMMKVMAAYVTIHNPGDKPVEINKVSSPDFSDIQMHRTIIKNGVASMVREKSIRIPAHGHFEFSPGHYHLMMFNPVKHFEAGDSSQLTFKLDSGKSETFKFPVKKATAYADNEHH